MIDRAEILAIATDLSLSHDVVEKDYVLGWLLAGIYAHKELADAWVFKGGTCLKKCYFETYRFSEDLEISRIPPAIRTRLGPPAPGFGGMGRSSGSRDRRRRELRVAL